MDFLRLFRGRRRCRCFFLPDARGLSQRSVAVAASPSGASSAARVTEEEEAITKFEGEWRFLHPFWPSYIWWQDVYYPSAGHAFIASKTYDRVERQAVSRAIYPGQAHRISKALRNRSQWLKDRYNIMLEIQRIKFTSTSLKNTLLSTDLREIVADMRLTSKEPLDYFWGKHGENGQNMFGKILMHIRGELRDGD